MCERTFQYPSSGGGPGNPPHGADQPEQYRAARSITPDHDLRPSFNPYIHTLEMKFLRPDGSVLDDIKEKVALGVEIWSDPSKVGKIQITLSGRSTVTANVDGYHCYYEDKHGNLQQVTGSRTPH
jgi:hypothetical protein